MIEQGWERHIDLSNGLSEVCKWTSIIMIGIEIWYLCWKWLHHSIQQRHWLRWCWKIIEKWWLNEGVKKNNLLQSILWNAWKKVHGFTFSVPAYLIFLIATLRIFFPFLIRLDLCNFMIPAFTLCFWCPSGHPDFTLCTFQIQHLLLLSSYMSFSLCLDLVPLCSYSCGSEADCACW